MDAPAGLDVVRASYDAVADDYVAMVVGDLTSEPWLRAALDAFAEQVRDVGPVLDAGCGPGSVSGHLHERGVDVRGIDLPVRGAANPEAATQRSPRWSETTRVRSERRHSGPGSTCRGRCCHTSSRG